jgi:hypothetical protein
MVNPVLYRLEEAKSCWQRITAPVQWVMGGDMWDHPMAKGSGHPAGTPCLLCPLQEDGLPMPAT